MHWGTTWVTAQRANVAIDDLAQVSRICIQTIRGVLDWQELRAVLQTENKKPDRLLREFYIKALLE